VDDDEDDRNFFLLVLEMIDKSVKCDTAENGLIALRQLTSGSSVPDLILLDLNMPVMNGRQFLGEIKKHEHMKNIPVIILSNSSDEATIIETKLLGAADFITKPNKLSLLEETLREIISNPMYKPGNA